MDREQLIRLYDRQYAGEYEGKFLTSPLASADAAHEVQLLSQWLAGGATWLDVACGTGFFLSKFPDNERAGLDLSPAMAERARQANPGIAIHTRSFLDDIPEFHNRWDLVSCMWYAYGLVDTMHDLVRLVANLAAWTAPQGRCFVPLADPSLIAGIDIPYRQQSPWPGEVTITGIMWSYAEPGGKVHAHQLAPHLEVMEGLFAAHFNSIELATYPPAMPGWEGRRRALVATAKKV